MIDWFSYPHGTGGFFGSPQEGLGRALVSNQPGSDHPWGNGGSGRSVPMRTQTIMVGACCSACAKGQRAMKPHIKVGVGACCDSCAKDRVQVGAVYVSDTELAKFGEAVGLMSADVAAAVDKENEGFASKVAKGAAMNACFGAELQWDMAKGQCTQVPVNPADPLATYVAPNVARPLTKFRLDSWTPFVVRWNDYAASAVHLPGTFYNELVPAFRQLGDEWVTKLGQKTRANVADVTKAPEEGWGWGTWAAVIGVGGLIVLPFALPVLAGLAIFLTKGKLPGVELPKLTIGE